MNLPPKKKRKQSVQRKGTASHVRTWTWTMTSRLYRQANPVCAICEAQGVVKDATPGEKKGVVDHIVRVNAGGAIYDAQNLMTVCQYHHDAKSRLEGMGWTCATFGKYGNFVPSNKEQTIEMLSSLLAMVGKG